MEESNVCYYGPLFGTTFHKALGPYVYDESGCQYIDFLCGAGVTNYGHNHPALVNAVQIYLQENGIVHYLDAKTSARENFIKGFAANLFKGSRSDYRLQFPGPTGTDAVEAALALARKVTGRSRILHLEGSYHGLTLGSLSITPLSKLTRPFGIRESATGLPYDSNPQAITTIDKLVHIISEADSDKNLPAALIVETTQCEAGIRQTSPRALHALMTICRTHGILFIIDDIQMGCGRSGKFFSFDFEQLSPDIVCLSKALSGLGLPLSLNLIKESIDLWKPGEFTGTFRGNNLALVSATAALEFWNNKSFLELIQNNLTHFAMHVKSLAENFSDLIAEARLTGFAGGMVLKNAESAKKAQALAFKHGLLIETVGSNREVLKLFPPLNCNPSAYDDGFERLEKALAETRN